MSLKYRVRLGPVIIDRNLSPKHATWADDQGEQTDWVRQCYRHMPDCSRIAWRPLVLKGSRRSATLLEICTSGRYLLNGKRMSSSPSTRERVSRPSKETVEVLNCSTRSWRFYNGWRRITFDNKCAPIAYSLASCLDAAPPTPIFYARQLKKSPMPPNIQRCPWPQCICRAIRLYALVCYLVGTSQA